MKITVVHLRGCVYLLIILGTMWPCTTGKKRSKAREVDECKSGRSDCHKQAICQDTRRSYRCKCKAGYYGTGRICKDENECDYDNGGCVHFCVNRPGNYTCSCLPGFALARDKHNCYDKNECLRNRGGCDHQCINTLGSYECRCNAGFSLQADGRTCKAGTWCSENLDCAHHCESTSRGTKCACRKGYVLHSNGRACIATCAVGNGGCQHNCTNTSNGPRCTCHQKYTLREDGKTCVATCDVNNGGCDRRCENTKQGPKCSCPPGYLLHQDGRTCLDVDECQKVNGGCSHDCVNTHGSFECICPKGFKVLQDERTCRDINECEYNQTCDHFCVNTPGSYQCKCNKGFQNYGVTHCADRNECSENNGGCQHTCVNAHGTFRCGCNHGFRLHTNKKDCVAASCVPLKASSKAVLACKKTGQEQSCVLSCKNKARFIASKERSFTYTCGPSTNFEWSHILNNATMPTCSESVAAPGYKRKIRLLFSAPDKCRLRRRNREKFQEYLNRAMRAQAKLQCTNLCHVNSVNLQCGSGKRRRRRFRQIPGEYVTADFEIQMIPQEPTDSCDIACVQKKTHRKLKRTVRNLKRTINKDQFKVKFEGEDYSAIRRMFKASRVQLACGNGQILIDSTCVACSVGTFYSDQTRKCELCPEGQYQDQEGQTSCITCPSSVHVSGTRGAKNVSECGGQCPPGKISSDGFEPCKECKMGTYQPEFGRTQCIPCGPSINTAREGAVGFQECQVSEKCKAGSFYSKKSGSCEKCPKSTYQPKAGQDYCIDCPGDTITDSAGVTSTDECKDPKCGGHIGQFQGYIQSPNWPGNYPNGIECTWSIAPEKGRRILVVVPEVFLPPQDKCGDVLVIRKSASPYSTTTYETCESTERPVAFTARTKRLWIQFKSNAKNSASGFSIPYVTYNEDYQDLIEDIVRDGRLYSSHQHQEVLKDRKLLSALLEVIATPYNYFKYANVSRSMFPESFIRLLTPKVRRFFS